MPSYASKKTPQKTRRGRTDNTTHLAKVRRLEVALITESTRDPPGIVIGMLFSSFCLCGRVALLRCDSGVRGSNLVQLCRRIAPVGVKFLVPAAHRAKNYSVAQTLLLTSGRDGISGPNCSKQSARNDIGYVTSVSSSLVEDGGAGNCV